MLVVRACRSSVALIVIGVLASVARAEPSSEVPAQVRKRAERSSEVSSQLPAQVRAHAVRRTGAIAVDGKLDEPVWSEAPTQGGFVQRFPKDAAAPSVETRFAVMYDDDAIYVGVWADDPRPELIRALLTRRDVDSPADQVTVAFDSYHDRRTAYAFQLNAAGVQRDILWFDDTNQDDSWDAVWTGDVAVTREGWTAEYRIPLSQLRFASADTQEWGLQVVRLVGRTGEQDAWSPWPRSTPQVVSKFGVLGGISRLDARPRLELVPYAASGVERLPVDAGDPLNEPYGWRRNVGVDLKYGLGPAFTLSATINPDFGQVEADPSQVNLSANELFLAEKRPFFLEGIDLFKLSIGNEASNPQGQFYSRRIGATPPRPSESYDFIDAPSSTTIYGAAKLTGKTAGGWSVGVLDAVTGSASTEIVTAPEMPGGDPGRFQLASAPLTNYAIARVKRDLNNGGTSIGASATAVHRNLDDPRLQALYHDQAYTAGLQLQHRWADNAWTANANLLGSWVHGTPEALARTQRNAVHYFQRPDRLGTSLDPTRTSLPGLSATWRVGRLGDAQHWRYSTGGVLRSPGLELNDAGFQLDSDHIVPFLLGEYRDDSPGEHVLNWGVSLDAYWIQTFEPRLVAYGLESNDHVQLANHWSLTAYARLDRARWDVKALRGGRSLRTDPRVLGNLNLTTDTRKPLRFSLTGAGAYNWTSGARNGDLQLGATIQARPNVDVFIGPSVSRRDDPLQYVDQVSDDATADRTHFVFGRVRGTVVAMTMRVNWTFSPRLTLQAYAQPFIATGRYDELKDVDNPGAARYADRFTLLGDALTLANGTYEVMRDGSRFRFDQPDFNFRQLRSTLVLRWEYRPGSTVFAIWSHGQTSDAFDDGEFQLSRDFSDLLSARSEDVVMVKANYWIGF
jgi:hypothetical protein